MSTKRGIVIHITTGESSEWRMALRNLANLAGDESVSTPPGRMQVVVNGDAARFLLATSPEATKLAQMAEAGVEISACRQSLERLGHTPEDLAEGVAPIPSGVAEVVGIQQRGATYLKLP